MIQNETEQHQYDTQCKTALNWLIKNEFLLQKEAEIATEMKEGKGNEKEQEKELEITSLGYSTIGSGLDPLQALIVYKELEKTRKNGIHFTNSLHLCYYYHQ